MLYSAMPDFIASIRVRYSRRETGTRAWRSSRKKFTNICGASLSTPSPLVGEGGARRRREGEGCPRTDRWRHTPHLPIASRWAPSSPTRGEGKLKWARSPPLPPIEERQPLEEMHVLLALEQRAVQRRDELARLLGAQRLGRDVLDHEELQPVE